MRTRTTTTPLEVLRERARKEEPAAIIADLARLFPELQRAPLAPWNPGRLVHWAVAQDNGTRGAARFILDLWSGSREAPWDDGPFHLVDLRVISTTGRAVIAEWVRDPFWL